MEGFTRDILCMSKLGLRALNSTKKKVCQHFCLFNTYTSYVVKCLGGLIHACWQAPLSHEAGVFCAVSSIKGRKTLIVYGHTWGLRMTKNSKGTRQLTMCIYVSSRGWILYIPSVCSWLNKRAKHCAICWLHHAHVRNDTVLFLRVYTACMWESLLFRAPYSPTYNVDMMRCTASILPTLANTGA